MSLVCLSEQANILKLGVSLLTNDKILTFTPHNAVMDVFHVQLFVLCQTEDQSKIHVPLISLPKPESTNEQDDEGDFSAVEKFLAALAAAAGRIFVRSILHLAKMVLDIPS